MNYEGINFYVQEVEREDAIGRQCTQALYEKELDLFIRNLGYPRVLNTGSSSTFYTYADLIETYTTTKSPQAVTAKKGTTTVQKHLSEMSNEQLRNYVKNLKGNI